MDNASRLLLASGKPIKQKYWAVEAGNSSGDYGTDVTVDQSGNVYVVSSVYINSNSAGHIAKYDKDGQELWQRVLGYDSSENVELTGCDYNIIDNHLYVCGSGTFSGTNGRRGGIVAKIDPNGNLIWQTRLTNAGHVDVLKVTGWDTVRLALKVDPTSSNPEAASFELSTSGGMTAQSGYYTPSTGNDWGAGCNFYMFAGYVSSGEKTVIWTPYFNSNYLPAARTWTGLGEVWAMSKTPQSQIYLIGLSGGNVRVAAVNYWDSNLNPVWSTQISGPNYLYPVAVCGDGQDNCFVLTRTSTNYFISKFNSTGTELWHRRFRPGANTTGFYGKAGHEMSSGMVSDSRGDIYLAGNNANYGWQSLVAKLPGDGSLTGTYGNYIWDTTGVPSVSGTPTITVSSQPSLAYVWNNHVSNVTSSTLSYVDAGVGISRTLFE